MLAQAPAQLEAVTQAPPELGPSQQRQGQAQQQPTAGHQAPADTPQPDSALPLARSRGRRTSLNKVLAPRQGPVQFTSCSCGCRARHALCGVDEQSVCIQGAHC